MAPTRWTDREHHLGAGVRCGCRLRADHPGAYTLGPPRARRRGRWSTARDPIRPGAGARPGDPASARSVGRPTPSWSGSARWRRPSRARRPVPDGLRRVLVVEDDEAIGALVQEALLGEGGYEV